ncbi:MAG: 50S ribosomal protein L4 [Candidatus Moraniibacteriota bacterium]
MPKITVKNLAGKEVESIELDPRLFDLPRNDALVHQVYVALTGNTRIAIAHTKDRGDRAGTGKKPWKQKGTGRARAGSVRSPLWRKGGVTFGPRNDRNFKKEANQKMRQKAVLITLSEKIRGGKLVVVDMLEVKDQKTKLFAEALSKLAIAPKSVLVSSTMAEKTFHKAARNIPSVTLANNADLNVRGLLDTEFILMSKAGITELDKRFSAWKK